MIPALTKFQENIKMNEQRLNAALGAASVRKTSPLDEVGSSLDIALNQLEEVVSTLEHQLDPIRTPMPEKERATNGPSAPPGNSSLVNSLHAMAYRVAQAAIRLRQLNSSLEL